MSRHDIVYSKAFFECVCDACGKPFTCWLPTRFCKDCHDKEMSKLPRLDSFAIDMRKEDEGK